MSDFFAHLFLFLLADLLETLHLHLVRTELAQLPKQPGAGSRCLEHVVGVRAGEGRGQRLRGVAIGVGPGLGEAGQHGQLTGDHHRVRLVTVNSRG